MTINGKKAFKFIMISCITIQSLFLVYSFFRKNVKDISLNLIFLSSSTALYLALINK